MACGIAHRILSICFSAGLLIASAGCAGRAAYERGVEAEKRGEAHLAYAYYAKAAQSSPDNRSYDRAIRRLGPLAASHWITEAKLARAEGRYAEAWKACMRALAIQPDRSEALSFYDDLMDRYGAQLAGVEREWRRKGARVLVIEVSPRTPPGRAELPESRSDQSDQGAVELPEIVNPPSPPAGNSIDGYLEVHRMSRDKNREVASIDGLTIRLRDTTDEGEADLDLYEGDRHIQKIRELKAGQSRLLLSPAGKWYRLTILKVNSAGHAADIGLNPA